MDDVNQYVLIIVLIFYCFNFWYQSQSQVWDYLQYFLQFQFHHNNVWSKAAWKTIQNSVDCLEDCDAHSWFTFLMGMAYFTLLHWCVEWEHLPIFLSHRTKLPLSSPRARWELHGLTALQVIVEVKGHTTSGRNSKSVTNE